MKNIGTKIGQYEGFDKLNNETKYALISTMNAEIDAVQNQSLARRDTIDSILAPHGPTMPLLSAGEVVYQQAQQRQTYAAAQSPAARANAIGELVDGVTQTKPTRMALFNCTEEFRIITAQRDPNQPTDTIFDLAYALGKMEQREPSVNRESLNGDSSFMIALPQLLAETPRKYASAITHTSGIEPLYDAHRNERFDLSHRMRQEMRPKYDSPVIFENRELIHKDTGRRHHDLRLTQEPRNHINNIDTFIDLEKTQDKKLVCSYKQDLTSMILPLEYTSKQRY